MLHLRTFFISVFALVCDDVLCSTVALEIRTYHPSSPQATVFNSSTLPRKHLRFRREPLCYQEMTNNAGYFVSPNRYMNSIDCYTLISTYENNIISLNFQPPENGFCKDCVNSYVEIFDGPTTAHRLLDRFTSHPSKNVIQSSGNSLLIHFHCGDNERHQRPDYEAQYITESRPKRQITGGTTSCGWLKGERDGVITSPNYPHNYPPNQWCQIKLYAPENYRFVLLLEDLNLEDDDKCEKDYLELIGGIDNDLAPRKRYCGPINESPGNISFPGNEVTVYFRSNNENEYSGFRISYYITKKTENSYANQYGPVENNFYPVENNFQQKFEKLTSSSPVTRSEALRIDDLFLAYPTNATVKEKESFDMHCVPKDPTIAWKWYKDGVLLNGTTPLPGLKLNKDLLTIEYMIPSLEGIYMCEMIWNNQSFAVQAWINISPNKDCFHFARKPKDMILKEETFVTMECSTTSNKVRISWEKDGVPLVGDSRVQILANGNILVITDLEKNDDGIYTCVARDPQNGCEKREDAVLNITPKHNNCGQTVVSRPRSTFGRAFVAGGKIIGGIAARKGAHPWQAMLWDPVKTIAICGGSLITEKWVLSAAHCVLESPTHYTQWLVFLGKNDIAESEPEQENRKVNQALVNPSYNAQTHDKDICLLELSDGVTFTDFIRPVCLGEPNFIEEEIFLNEYQLGLVTGWGRLVERGPQSRLLQELQLPIVPQKICRQSTILTVTNNMFCAGYAEEIAGVGRDACEGDSGGPFVVLYQNHWYLVGIVSWSEGYGECARPNKYGFYTKVSNFYHWIKEKTGIL